jgi:putative colanic acid biosynthesis acetyltransferase WcaF
VSHVQLNTYNNAWYSPKASGFKCFVWYFINILFFSNAWNPLSAVKVWLLRLFGAKVGQGVVLKPGISIKYPWLLAIGDHSWIGEGVWIDNLTQVTIGHNVCISQGAMLLTGNHNYKKSSFDLITGEIVLEDGVWIGAKSVVCPGVVCQTHAVLSVLSVATQDLEPFTIYQGNPAVAIRKRILQSEG